MGNDFTDRRFYSKFTTTTIFKEAHKAVKIRKTQMLCDYPFISERDIVSCAVNSMVKIKGIKTIGTEANEHEASKPKSTTIYYTSLDKLKELKVRIKKLKLSRTPRNTELISLAVFNYLRKENKTIARDVRAIRKKEYKI